MDAARSQIVGVLPREPHIQGKGSWLFASSLLEDLFQSTSVTPNKMPLASVLGTGHLPFSAFISEVTETPHHYLIFCPDHSPPLGGGGRRVLSALAPSPCMHTWGLQQVLS